VNIKKQIIFVLLGTILFLLPANLKAAPTGAVAAKITIEFQGDILPVTNAQVTIMDKSADLEAIDFLAKRDAKNTDNEKRWYHLLRYTYLVKAIEDSRRAGVRQIRTGIITKRTDRNGEVLVRYLAPGNYFVGAYKKMGQKTAAWCVPFSVAAGRVTRINLDNSNAFEIYHPALYP
jgi:hypothetical protein